MKTNDLKYYVKLKQKKYREECKQFLVEGIHLIDECLKSKYYKKSLVKVFLKNDFSDDKLVRDLRNFDKEYLKSNEFSKLAETENTQGIIGVCNMNMDFPKTNRNIICALDNINDPGNLGTILRTCWWFGIENILIGKDSVDLYNSKVIRASQGAIFNLPIKTKINLKEELNILYKNGYEILLTDLSAKYFIEEYKFRSDKKYVLVLGNEANGISKELKAIQHFNKIKIKSYSECESLNVASSASIIFYEIKKSIIKNEK